MQHQTKDPKLRKTIAANIRYFVEYSTHPQPVFANVMGVTTRQLARYMSGESEPTAAALYALARFCLIDINEFFKER